MIRNLIGLGLATSFFALTAPGIAAQATSAPAARPATPAPAPAPTAAPAPATPHATTQSSAPATTPVAASTAAPAPATITAATTLPFDQTVTGEIKAKVDEGCAAPDPAIKVYQFTAEADSRVEITMTADDFDTILEIGKVDGCTFTSLGSNDDGGGPDDGLNSRLVAHLREAGTYIVHARGIQDDSAGKFELKMRRLPAPAGPPTPVVIALGGKVEAELGANSAIIADAASENAGEGEEASVIESGRPYMLYSLTGEAGQSFLIQLESDEFDPIVEIGTMSPLGYSVATSNDDGGEEDDGLNSRLSVTFTTAGTMLIRVSPLGSDSGKYTLRVRDPKVVEEEARIAAEREAERQSRRERRRRR